ncbi:MAG: heme-copper oxidase subunit III [Acidobacteriota bacterium]
MSTTAGAGAGDAAGRVVSIRPEAERGATAQVGMLVFLGSWAMMFAALFFSYTILRLRVGTWPPPGGPSLPTVLPAVSTGVILVSSITLHLSLAARRRGAARNALTWVILTFLLGSLFVGLQGRTWLDTWTAGLTQWSGVLGSIFYLMTVFHALHVVVGLGVLGWLGVRLWRETVQPERAETSLQVLGMFWHFVGLVWVAIYVSVFLL